MTHPGFRIQPDWDIALSENSKYIWFHQYDSSSTKYRKLEYRNPILVPDDEDITCNLISQNLLQLSSHSPQISKFFQRPDSCYDLLSSTAKNPRSHLSSFDVSPSGELFIASFSGPALKLYESQTGIVRRSLEGHVGDILTSKFFPSGLVALTAGSDMQLKIWCLITGRCAATLAPRCAGAVTGINTGSKSEPGGHRAGILDTAIIDRGRNIASIDRLGWLRLWDVATQTCLSAIPVTPSALDVRTASSIVLEEVTCLAIRKHPNLPIQSTSPVDDSSEPWYQIRETSSTIAQEVSTSDALIAVGTGTNASVRLYELANRQKGCVVQCTLPSANGSVESCAFPEEMPASMSKRLQLIDVPKSCVSTFMDYGLFAGSQHGELASWDIRQTRQPLWLLTHEKGAVQHIRVCRRPNCQYLLVIVSRSDGRTLVYPYNPAVGQDDSSSSPSSIPISLELTGVNCEPIGGLSMVYQASGELSVWSATRSGKIHQYKKLLDEISFKNLQIP
ncbi:unnamed protein product [Trichobilharzia szidati]|nr:unnamed protein product [Trichobilharzia szidati]